MTKKEKILIVLIVSSIIAGFSAGFIIGEVTIEPVPESDEKSAYELLQEIPERMDENFINTNEE